MGKIPMNSNDYDFHDPRSSKYWTNTGDVTTGVYDPIGGGPDAHQFLRRIGMETAHVSGALTGNYAAPVALHQATSKHNMPGAYGPNEVQTSIAFNGKGNAEEFNKRMTQWGEEYFNSPDYKHPGSPEAIALIKLQAERQIQRQMVDEGKAVEYQLDHKGNHTGRYRTGKVIAASPGWSMGEGRQFSNLNSGQGDEEFERGRERILASHAYEGTSQPTQGVFTPLNAEGLTGPRGEQVIGGGSFGYNPAPQAVGVDPNDYYGRSPQQAVGGDVPTGNGAPYVDPAYAAKFQEIMSRRVQPGDLVRMAASARGNAGQNVPYFGDDNEAGRAYLNR